MTFGSFTILKYIMIAPIDSTTTVSSTILNRVEKVLLLSSSLIISLTIILFLNEDDDLKSNAKILVMVSTPSPPNCINMIIIVCPKSVKSFPVSRMANPVTVTALVDVKSAWTKLTFLKEAAGNIKQNVPKSIRKIKLSTNKVAGCIAEFPKLDTLNDIDKNPINTAKNWLNAVVSSTSYPELNIQSIAKIKLKNDIIKNIKREILTYLFFEVRNKYKLKIREMVPKIKLSGL